MYNGSLPLSSVCTLVGTRDLHVTWSVVRRPRRRKVVTIKINSRGYFI